ncbi:PREDICTED: gamma-crystallin B-like [Nanorana parkeri]|uniref:gamma-crystallin B-like n=1 Tax=Nanorana parkeri TaxID=125878 RepID=UPI000854D251|nr:PREDICTED: gamma-crystallin B-like [Nanorana parkeri]
MNAIELFEFPDFKGDPCFIDHDFTDLKDVPFLKKVLSLKVHRDTWIIFSETDYKGEFSCYKAGSYSSLSGFDSKIRSVRCVKGGLDNHKITLYEEETLGGEEVTLQVSVDSVKSHGFGKKALSHKVVSGAWVLYSRENYEGGHMVTVAGDKVDKYDDSFKNVNSLKPVLPLQ